jgi:hypothetical protein
VIAVRRPDTTRALRAHHGFPAVDHIAELLPATH